MVAVSDTREMIMGVARATVQSHGYSGLSFRELAKEVGIKSASIHYHFPTKGDLGAALARRYAEDADSYFEDFLAESQDPAIWFRKYTAVFRAALSNDNRMCLCGIMAAEYDDLPEQVKIEVNGFTAVNIRWLVKILSLRNGKKDQKAIERQARAIFAAIEGAQLYARSSADIGAYDEIVETYRDIGLIP